MNTTPVDDTTSDATDNLCSNTDLAGEGNAHRFGGSNTEPWYRQKRLILTGAFITLAILGGVVASQNTRNGSTAAQGGSTTSGPQGRTYRCDASGYSFTVPSTWEGNGQDRCSDPNVHVSQVFHSTDGRAAIALQVFDESGTAVTDIPKESRSDLWVWLNHAQQPIDEDQRCYGGAIPTQAHEQSQQCYGDTATIKAQNGRFYSATILFKDRSEIANVPSLDASSGRYASPVYLTIAVTIAGSNEYVFYGDVLTSGNKNAKSQSRDITDIIRTTWFRSPENDLQPHGVPSRTSLSYSINGRDIIVRTIGFHIDGYWKFSWSLKEGDIYGHDDLMVTLIGPHNKVLGDLLGNSGGSARGTVVVHDDCSLGCRLEIQTDSNWAISIAR